MTARGITKLKDGTMIQVGTNDLDNTVERLLSRARLTECSECRSWIYDTRAARSFHVRRCAS